MVVPVDVVVLGGAGFLLAVLWFDLMFDVQVRGHEGERLPDPVLASISAYYRRVTTDAAPMNRLVALAMLVTLAGVVGQALAGDVHRGWSAASAVFGVVPITLAAGRVVPAAVRLGGRTDDLAVQSQLARQIWRDHVVCFTSVALLVGVQTAAALTS